MTSMSSCSYNMSYHVQAAVGKDITKTDLVPAFQSLLKDCEAEVSGKIYMWRRLNILTIIVP